MRRRIHLWLATFALLAFASPGLAVEMPVLLYDFEDAGFAGGDGATVTNRGSLGTDGVIVGQVAGQAGGAHAGSMGSALFADGNHFIQSNLSADALGVNGPTNYTAAAWINAQAWGGGDSGDSMVFGQEAGNALHLGFRNNEGDAHYGHWGADHTHDTNVPLNEWHHMAYRYKDGVQSIWIDGQRLTASQQRELINSGNVIIGTTRTDQNRDFTGFIDDAVIYNVALDAASIYELAARGDPLNNAAGNPNNATTNRAWKVTAVDLADNIVEPQTVGNLTQAKEVVAGTRGPLESSFGNNGIAMAQLTELNISDQANNQNAGLFRATGDASQQVLGKPDVGPPGFGNAAQDNYVMVATGQFTTGQTSVTFGVNSDDGFGLIVRDAMTGQVVPFSAFAGDTTTQIDGMNGAAMGELYYPGGRGAHSNGADTNTDNQPSYGQLDLAGGIYDYQLINWEGGGGASLEAFYQLGGIPADTTFINNNFTLFGDSQGGLNWTPIDVTTYKLINAVPHPTPGNLADADAMLAGNFMGIPEDVRTMVLTDTINFFGGRTGPDEIIPGIPDGEDRVAIQARALIRVDEAGVYSFAVISDDGFRLDFTDDMNDFMMAFGDGGTMIDADGNLIFDAGRGDGGESVGTIFLERGFHELMLTWWEGGGGESLELYSAFGEIMSFNANPDLFALVGDVANGGLPVFQEALTGVGVPEPATGMLGLLGLAALGFRRRRNAA